MLDYEVALNNCIRKIFTFNRWESARFLRQSFARASIGEIFQKQKSSFIRGISVMHNPILSLLLLHINSSLFSVDVCMVYFYSLYELLQLVVNE